MPTADDTPWQPWTPRQPGVEEHYDAATGLTTFRRYWPRCEYCGRRAYAVALAPLRLADYDDAALLHIHANAPWQLARLARDAGPWCERCDPTPRKESKRPEDVIASYGS